MQCALQPGVFYNSSQRHMESSTIYIELKAMIEKNWLQKSVSGLDQMLKQLEEEGQVTAEERRSLLELYVSNLRDRGET